MMRTGSPPIEIEPMPQVPTLDAAPQTSTSPSRPVPRRRRLPKGLGEWAGLVGVSLLIGAALTIVLANGRRAVVPTFLILSTVSLCFGGGYVVAYRVLFEGLLTRSRTWKVKLVWNVAAVATAAAVGGVAAIVAVSGLTGPTPTLLKLRILGVGLAVLAAVRVLKLGYEGLRMQVREGELREERARRQALMSELAALQARTDPHFLFNSLNTVAGLIEEDPARAAAVVTRLSGFFRHNLQSSRIGAVPLGDEVRAVSAYFEIQALRFSDRLEWTVEIPPDLETVPLPPLTLQPLAENAVVHGTSSHDRTTHVVVKAESAGDRLTLTVDDDGPGPGGSTHRGSESSITDLAERIHLLYDGDATLETGRSPQGGFRVRLDLPRSGFRWSEESR